MISAPTLILSGASDGQAPASGQRFFCERIPKNVKRVVSGGHNFIFDNDEAIDVIVDFLSDKDSVE